MNHSLNDLCPVDASGAAEGLCERGYALYQCSLLQRFPLRSVIEFFIGLTGLPENERKLWEIYSGDTQKSDDGLIERSDSEHDRKFFFHYKSMDRIMRHIGKTDLYRRQRAKIDEFLHNLDSMHKNLLYDMQCIASAFDKLHPGYSLYEKLMLQHQEGRGVLRLLYYLPGYRVVAKPHYDQSMLTFHVADSHPGLFIGENQRDVYVPRRDGMLLFNGIKAEIATSGECAKYGPLRALNPSWNDESKLRATLHGAVSNEDSIREGRWAIVFFCHSKVGLTSEEVSLIGKQKLRQSELVKS